MSLSENRTPATATPPQGRVSVFALLRWTLAALVVTGGLLSAGLMFFNQMDWWHGFIAASIISVPAAILGLSPVVLIAAKGDGTPSQLSFGFVAGTLLRMMSALLFLLIACHVYHVPKAPAALLMMVYYCAVLAAEVGVLVSEMRRAFPLGKITPVLAT